MIRVLTFVFALGYAPWAVGQSTPPAPQTTATAQQANESVPAVESIADGESVADQHAAERKAAGKEAAAPAEAETRPLASARDALATFLKAVNEDDFRTAASVLDFSAVEPQPDEYAKIRYVRRLQACIERIAFVEPAELSDSPSGPPVSLSPNDTETGIELARAEDGQWRFSPTTVQRIDALYQVLDDPPADEPEPQPASTETASPPSEADEPAQDPPSAAAEVPSELSSARRTMRTLFDALDNTEYETAVATIDFSQLQEADPKLSAYERLGYARRLREILERLAPIDYAEISDDPQGPTFRFPPDRVNQPIEIVRDDEGFWRFSDATVGKIDSLFELYKNKPVINLPEESKPWYARQLFLGNETWRILTLFGAIFVGLLIGQFLRGLLRWRAASLERKGHHLRAAVLRTIAAAVVGVTFLAGLRGGTSGLILDHGVGSLVATTIHVTFVVVVGYVFFRLVDVVVALLQERAEKSGSAMNSMLAPVVSTSMRVTIVVLVLLEIATAVSDQPPSAVLAGLGAGGLAIGLAAQETIKNLFGSVMIFADRPFELGDRIAIDGHDGPVEKVGFRSTRIRTLDGHFVTVPNGEMANKTIQNIGKRPFIRRVMNIRIASDTPPEKVRQALQILRDLVEQHDGRHDDYPPRVFLEDFLETALNIRVIYWFHPPNYWDYCDYGERFNLQVIEAFHEAGICFAVPSQRLLVDGEGDLPPRPGSESS